jgi:dienelactone hydrolase
MRGFPITVVFLIMSLLLFLTGSISVMPQEKTTFDLQPAGDDVYKTLVHFYQYDKDIPFDARVVTKMRTKTCDFEKIVFTGIRTSRVPGYLAFPITGKPPFPCVLMLHGAGADKEMWWKETDNRSRLTKELLEAGYAVLCLDAKCNGERIHNNDYENFYFTMAKKWYYTVEDAVIQSSIEYRRALDYLEGRPEVDSSRIGIIGYSMGGIMTFILSAVEPRIKVSVACVTPFLKQPEAFAIWPLNFSPHIEGRQFLMMEGSKNIDISVDNADRLYSLINCENKQLLRYKIGFRLPDKHTDDALQWFKNLL